MTWKRRRDGIILLLGLWLLVSPTVLTFSDGGDVSATFWVGLSIALVGVWTVSRPRSQAAEGCQILLAGGYFFAPWAFDFAGAAAWNAWCVSLLVIVTATAAFPLPATTAAGPDGTQRT